MKYSMSELRLDFRRRLPAIALVVLVCLNMSGAMAQTTLANPAATPPSAPAAAPATAYLTAQQDRQRLMDLLGIKELRPGT